MPRCNWQRAGLLVVLLSSLGLFGFAGAARADAPFRADTHFVTDFPFTCGDFVANAHAVDDQTFVAHSDGSYTIRVDEVETFSFDTRSVLVQTHYLYKSAGDLTQSQGVSQLWSADGRLLLTVAGHSTWSAAAGRDATPHYDPNPLWQQICTELRP